ncbi:ComEC/Rec2 family competence protein [Conexibacter woesei]|uniref:Hydrolase (Metallo-beta-lactamase superfamily)-like protein n=1 Tax=Conexibacter woesei (strain DSM 14684 / CCUG 47730 / CIP 108061 / JCM 11494 / NBRC 100937 / ID131577) TaxID=469383 RepID=D3FD76_CONWI|nr:MBL fold protein [Conexibacter woesei]ADB53468.1 hydrolase (metallo-beta-lactamase superfamily)-like protein [Conexibacter woesei DSM 14684]
MPARLTFQFLDTGMGDGTLVQMRRHGAAFDRLMLVDFGEKGSPFTVAHEDALAYLVEQIDQNSMARGSAHPYVDGLVLTHPDSDHYNKVPQLLDATYPSYGKRRRLRFGKLSYSGASKEYKTVVEGRLNGRVDAGIDPMPSCYASKLSGSHNLAPWDTHGPIKLYVLSSNWPHRAAKTNPKSVVLMFELDGKRVILCGDATKATERHILKTVMRGDTGQVRCHALKLGHHGSKGSSGVDWVKATRPHAIFASGDQVWTHPYCGAICRFVVHDTLVDHFSKDSYFTCGDRGTYHNNATTLAICMNLWYLAQRKSEKLIDEETGASVVAAAGACFGVQWELTIEAGHPIELTRTQTYLPKPANVDDPYPCAAPSVPVPA